MQDQGKAFDHKLLVPDLWQQEALRYLREGLDVVLHAPTGAGKTFVFEMLMDSGWRGRAIYTVPTRALANDKAREWMEKGWDVGVCTGDLRFHPDAQVTVATLETQRSSTLKGQGPDLMVIDEYQMLGDLQRGVNYEVVLAMAPPDTQLLLMSGSVANPETVADWLESNGRKVELVSEGKRPVPLEEIFADALPRHFSESVRGHWPKIVTAALGANMGPVLLFAPKRLMAEDIAQQLATGLPPDEPLALSPEQKKLAGKTLIKLLKRRIAPHHSGLDYKQRAGLIEPLAKAGQLRAVVSTTGLGAGVNFSMRSVIVTDREYRVDDERLLLRPDELLQMFGRAGRRGLDERGYAIVAPRKPRLSEARPLPLRPSNRVDWCSLLEVMRTAGAKELSPTQEAENFANRLFRDEPVPLGFEAFLSKQRAVKKQPVVSSSEKRDSSRDEVIEMLNSEDRWERRRGPVKIQLADALFRVGEEWRPALSCPETLAGVKAGSLWRRGRGRNRTYGRELPVARFPEEEGEGRVALLKSFRRRLREHFKEANPKLLRRYGKKLWSLESLEKSFGPFFPDLASGGRLTALVERNGLISARLDYGKAHAYGWKDQRGETLLNPPLRKRKKEWTSPFTDSADEGLGPDATLAETWFHLGLIDREGCPTRRGTVFSFFHQGEGLAVAAALEDESYPIEEMIHDLANLRAGHRFAALAGEGSRLGAICQRNYGDVTCGGYLRRGLPPEYGDGAAEAVRETLAHPEGKQDLFDDELRSGDLERAHLEWKSLLSLIAHAPNMEWDRWKALQTEARSLSETNARGKELPKLPPLEPEQRKRHQSRLQRGRESDPVISSQR
ncbi:MAG: DEAD/DEAH box helicase [Opitutales bacterium]|nr:DEAD/DEAH box helicase [Opitutales bacterium]